MSTDDAPWQDFSFEAKRYARACGRAESEAQALGKEMDRLLEKYQAVVLGNPSVPALRKSLETEYLQAQAEKLHSELRAQGKAEGHNLWRLSSTSTPLAEPEQLFQRMKSFGLPLETITSLYEAGKLEGRHERLAAEQTVVELHRLLYGHLRIRSLTRRLSNPLKIFPLLLSLNSEKRQLIKEQYFERYGRSLAEVVERNTSAIDSAALIALLDGNVAKGILGYIRASVQFDPEMILDIERAIWGLPRNERRFVRHEFQGLQEEAELIARNLPSEYRLALKHLIAGSTAECDANLISYDLKHKRFAAVVERISLRGQLARDRLQAAYEACFSQNLAAQLSTELPPKFAAYAEALLTGSDSASLAWKGKLILEQKLPGWIGELLRGKDRATFLNAFVEIFGGNALLELIEARYHGRDLEIAKELLHRGHVSWAKLLWFAVAGIGTDEAAVVALLENTDIETQNRLKLEFHRVWQSYAPWYEKPFPQIFGNLRRRLWLECAGDCWFELRQALESPGTPYETLLARYQHETSSHLVRLLYRVSKETHVLDADMHDVKALQGKLKQSPAEETFRFNTLVALTKLDCEICRMTKHLIGNHVTTAVAGAGVFLAAFMLTYWDLEILTVMIVVGIISALLRFVLKVLLKGPGYHRDEMLGDLGFALVDGCTLYLGRLFRQALIRASARFTSKLGLKQSIAHAIKRLREVSSEVESESIRDLVNTETSAPPDIRLEDLKLDPSFSDSLLRMVQLANEAPQRA